LHLAEGRTFIDAFLGGGSVSLLAKVLGYKVICNDYALRSHIIGRALIENNTKKIHDADIIRLFVENPNNTHFIENTYDERFFLKSHARFMDNALANIQDLEDECTRHLMLHLCCTFLVYMRPFAEFDNKCDVPKVAAEDYEDIKHKSNAVRLVYKYSRGVLGNLRLVASRINYAICNNGHLNEAHQLDVFKFLDQVEGDTIYFDPPYTGAAATYEYEYAVLDSILAGKKVRMEDSVFNKRDALKFLDEMFKKAQHIPTWIISFSDIKISRADLFNIIAQYREIEEIPIIYRYTVSHKRSTRKAREEILAVAR